MAFGFVLLGLCAAATLQSTSSAGIDPVALWPMNSRSELKDVIGGKDGVATGVSLEDSQPIDLKDVADNLPSEFQGASEEKSYQFTGSKDSFVTIPRIPMENDFTIVTFIKPEKDGPIFEWGASWWGDHLWVIEANGYQLFFRPMDMNSGAGTYVLSPISLNVWNMVAFSYQRSTGRGTLFINNEKVVDQSALLPGNTAHNTEGTIQMGAVGYDVRYYRGGISCASLFDKFVTSMDEINWGPIAGQCFNGAGGPSPQPDYCMLPKDAGRGTKNTITMRFYYIKKKNMCKKFKYYGADGNKNNFKTKGECSAVCKTL